MFAVEYWDQGGLNHSGKNSLQRCHYRGHIRNSVSRVALSNCNGLHGLIELDRVHYLIEPLWNVSTNHNQSHPHVVYRQDTDNTFSLSF